MAENNRKESLSVKEIEEFAKKNRFQVAFGLSIVLAGLFSYFLGVLGYSILAATVGAVLGIFFPGKIASVAKKIMLFVGKQEQTTQLVLGAVLLIISIFLSPVIFLILGLHGGKDLKTCSGDAAGN